MREPHQYFGPGRFGQPRQFFERLVFKWVIGKNYANEHCRLARHAFLALIVANLMLAFGPWMVRMADVGPVASAFWRIGAE